MTLLRSLAIVSASLLLLNSCGKKEEKAPEQPVQTTTEANADELFDEFYDSSAVADNEMSEETVVEEPVKEFVQNETPQFIPDGRYVVQVSCVASEAIAEDVARKLEKSDYPVYVAEVTNPTPTLLGTYYRIRIGGFNTVTDAKVFGENFLIPSNYDYWVDNRSNDNVGIGDFGLGEETTLESEPYTEETATQETYSETSYESDFVEETVEKATEVVETAKETVTETVETATSTATETVENVTETVTENPVSNAAESVVNTVDDEWGTSDW